MTTKDRLNEINGIQSQYNTVRKNVGALANHPIIKTATEMMKGGAAGGAMGGIAKPAKTIALRPTMGQRVKRMTEWFTNFAR